MHVVFIPYGKRSEVELLLRDMEAQKFPMIIRKGNETKAIYIQGVVRYAPFGIYEYVFPKEMVGSVMRTLATSYNNKIGKLKELALRFVTGCKEYTDDFKDEKPFLWIRDHVGRIVLGIREDEEITEPEGSLYAGWTHERL